MYNKNFGLIVSIKQGVDIPRQLDIIIRLLLIVLFCCITFWCESTCAKTCDEDQNWHDSVAHDCDYSCAGCAELIVGDILITNTLTINFLIHITTIAPRHLVLEPQYRPPIPGQ
ncbi:MAG: hypothetical protein HN757_09300 [Calditrichaeota bacterium]|nr:hypothetical protein [Calditrichota bacterium]